MYLKEDHTLLQEAVRSFAQQHVAPGAAERDETSAFPREVLQAMAEMGLLGVIVPEAWGGAGMDMLSQAIALEEIAAADGAVSTIMAVQALVNSILLKFGTEAQKERFLKPLATGQHIGAFALTEPEVGSNAAALTTTAVREGEGYLLNGVKQFITSGKEGNLTIVFAVTDKKADKKGMSAFLVPTESAGYHADHVEKKMGQKCSDTAQVVLENCYVPLENRLGEEGEGYKIALSNLEGGRISIAAQCVGMARAAYEEAVKYAQERKSFGKTLLEHQAIAFKLAEMATRLEAARLLVHQAADVRQNGGNALAKACMAKLFASETAEYIASEALQIHGGYGYLKDFPIERIYRDVRVCKIYEGTSEIQKMVIAGQIQKGLYSA